MEELLYYRGEKGRSSSNRYELWKLPGVNPDGPEGGADEEDWSEVLHHKRSVYIPEYTASCHRRQ